MRRHAKASSAGSNQRRATSPGDRFDLAFATRGAPRDVKGSGGPSTLRLALLTMLAIAASLLVTASPALALDNDSANGNVFVAKNANSSNAGSHTSFLTLAVGPLVEGQSISNIADTSAIFKALINPNGEATGYLFEYVTKDQFEVNGYAEAISVPTSGEAIGSGSETVAVSQQVAGLAPGTAYHFRVLATNSSGSANGTDQLFTTYAEAPTFDTCPTNSAFRTGPSAKLPDCRVYEQASPVDKNGTDVSGSAGRVKAAASGNAVTFFSNGGMPGGVGAQDYPFFIAHRDGADWSTHGLLPPPTYGTRAEVGAWTPDLDYVFSTTRTPGISSKRFLVRSSGDGSIAEIANALGSYYVAGVSSDGSKVFFEATAKLTPDAVGEEAKNFYVWDRDTDTVSLAGVLPASACGGPPPCTPVAGSFAGPYNWFLSTSAESLESGGASRNYALQEEHVISTNGDRAFFTAANTGQLFLRKNATGPNASTVQVNASQRATPDPNGAKPAAFMQATPSGSTAFFTSCEKLTDDSTAVSTADDRCDTEEQGQDLYAYDTAAGDLTDLTIDGSDPNGADVKGVIGASDDGSYVYFAANGDLDGSGPASLGDCTVDSVGNPTGFCNLYLSHDGATTFIARLDTVFSIARGGVSNWKPSDDFAVNDGGKNPRGGHVSADGKTLLFDSQVELTANAEGTQLYRFHDGDPGLLCLTCDPSGNTSGGGDLQSVMSTGQVGPDSYATTVPRNLSADGSRFFFESAQKLVAADTNGDNGCPHVGYWQDPACQDVYEWEANGAGSCHSSHQNGGCLYLLSTGTSPFPAFFADASSSGDDVFIFTRDSLVPQDRDEIRDLYDVRVDGGLASQQAELPPVCEGEACRGSGTSAPPSPGASSAVFQGEGNPPIKRHHKKKHHRHHKKKHHHKRSHKRASHNRGGAK